MIETALLKPGSETPAGDGVQGAQRCILLVGTAQRERAGVIKRMALPKVLAEAFSAVLLRAWGLNVPDPYLVPEGTDLAFASADDGYPSLKQRLQFSAALPAPVQDVLLHAASVLSAGFAQTPLAVTCDEAIDNRDRNIGNILWDGYAVAWIDHELCLGLGEHLADANKLAHMATQAQKHEAVQQGAVAAWMALERSAPTDACAPFANTPLHHTTTTAFATLVSQRLNALGGRLLARFPQPKDLLSAP